MPRLDPRRRSAQTGVPEGTLAAPTAVLQKPYACRVLVASLLRGWGAREVKVVANKKSAAWQVVKHAQGGSPCNSHTA
jgi:hypothetical protein